MKIQERFDVQASPDAVWAYLIDPHRVVECLPGAELLEIEDERTFTGRVRVQVGPVTAAFRGRARFEELDATERRVRMAGEGQETSGGSSATMSMTSHVVPLPDGGARVDVDAEIEIVGRLVQFGRGMIEEVSRQMFGQFAGCVRGRLEAGPAPGRDAAGGTGAGPDRAPRPLRLIPLVWTAVVARVRRLFSRGGAA